VGIGGAIPGIGAIICAVILLQIMKPGADIR
jgi:DHA1 family inner membrane transport protein